MVNLPDNVKKMILKQQMIIVGTTDKAGLCNISPRTSFHLEENNIYWLELFKHKTFHNFSKNKWVSVAVIDKEKLSGFQLKGTVNIIKEKKRFDQIKLQIIDRLTRLHKERILKQIGKEPPSIIKFKTKIVYPLKPNEISDIPLVLDSDVKIGRLAGGINAKKSFGLEPKSLEN
ncbi:MAG: pyridoxamine 5'-phosphate oxidase family protein [Nitrosopumilaceae archaeon]